MCTDSGFHRAPGPGWGARAGAGVAGVCGLRSSSPPAAFHSGSTLVLPGWLGNCCHLDSPGVLLRVQGGGRCSRTLRPPEGQGRAPPSLLGDEASRAAPLGGGAAGPDSPAAEGRLSVRVYALPRLGRPPACLMFQGLPLTLSWWRVDEHFLNG